MGWSSWGRDWSDRPGTDVVADALRGARPGGILLLHDGWASWDGIGPGTELVDGSRPRFDRGEVLSELLDQYACHGYAATSVGGLLAELRTLHALWFGD